MDIKAIARNVKNKGFVKTVRIAGENIRFDPACTVWKAKGKAGRKKIGRLIAAGREEEALEMMLSMFPPMIERGIELLDRSKSKIEKKGDIGHTQAAGRRAQGKVSEDLQKVS